MRVCTVTSKGIRVRSQPQVEQLKHVASTRQVGLLRAAAVVIPGGKSLALIGICCRSALDCRVYVFHMFQPLGIFWCPGYQLTTVPYDHTAASGIDKGFCLQRREYSAVSRKPCASKRLSRYRSQIELQQTFAALLASWVVIFKVVTKCCRCSPCAGGTAVCFL